MTSRALTIALEAAAELGEAAVRRRAPGPIVARATRALIALEMAGKIAPAEVNRAFDAIHEALASTSKNAVGAMRKRKDLPSGVEAIDQARRHAAALLELARARHHLRRFTPSPQDKPGPLPLPITKIRGPMSHHDTDMPAELSEQYDISGCACSPAVSGLGALTVGSGLRQHAGVGYAPQIAIAGLGALTVAGLPSYLFTRKNLASPVVRRRLGAAIKAMTPKMRRRVVSRLQAALGAARVSGSIRSVTPAIAGWNTTSVAVGRCPYASVAGALTP